LEWSRFCGQVVNWNLTVNERQSEGQPKRRRRHYDEEFKRSAVEMLEGGERSAVQLSRELGISDCSLGKWKRQYGKAAQAKGSGTQAEQERIAQLERQVEYLSRQREILKKALAILGQEPSDSTK
jgi:transposase